MDSLRFYVFAAALFGATFAGGTWVLTPRPAQPTPSVVAAQTPAAPAAPVATPSEAPKAPGGLVPLKPDSRLPTFHRVDRDDPKTKLEQSSYVSDNDPVRDRLRNEVLDYAKAVRDDPCNTVLKKNYIKAVVAYARAWISIVPCIGTKTCRSGDSEALDRAAQAFGTPLDIRVREAMRVAHSRAIFGPADFPKDTVNLVSQLAADSFVHHQPGDTETFRKVAAQLDNVEARQDCGR